MNQMTQPNRSQVAAPRAFYRPTESAVMHHGVLLTVFLVCLNTGTLWGKAVPDPRLPFPQEAARVAEAVRVDRAPRLDGTLHDPLWQSANPITDFRQREPHEGEPPTEKTEVRILYTRHAVYFGIYCYDSEPSRIIATELRRDVSQDLDDNFEILIDSNHNRRGAYEFEVNPLVTQHYGP